MKYLRFARHWIWLAPLALGVAFIAAGGYMVLEGRNAHNDVRDSIAQENITVSADAPAFGGEVVDSAAKADSQAEAILHHTLTATGGYLYAEMGQYQMPEGNYILPKGTYATADGGTTQDVARAAKENVVAAAGGETDAVVGRLAGDEVLAGERVPQHVGARATGAVLGEEQVLD